MNPCILLKETPVDPILHYRPFLHKVLSQDFTRAGYPPH